jgi:hypothetical protein
LAPPSRRPGKSGTRSGIGKQFAAHSHVNHSKREYSRGKAHSNTAESFSSMLKCARWAFSWNIAPFLFSGDDIKPELNLNFPILAAGMNMK